MATDHHAIGLEITTKDRRLLPSLFESHRAIYFWAFLNAHILYATDGPKVYHQTTCRLFKRNKLEVYDAIIIRGCVKL